MAETVAAVDPARPAHLAIAADPYLDPTRVVVTTSTTHGRSWRPAVEVLPPGYAKSYDPQLAYAPDGTLLVVAGASRAGPAGCHPGSVVFGARIRGRSVTGYRILARAARGGFVDRPMTARTAAGPIVTYTASSGPGAQCLDTPRRSRVMIRSFNWQLRPAADARTVPAASRRVYGSAVTTFGDQRLAVATLAVLHKGRTTVSVATGSRNGHDLTVTATLPAGAPAPEALPGLGGVYTSMATVAGQPGAPLTVLWSHFTGTRPTMRIASSVDGRRFSSRPAPTGSHPAVLATAVALPDQTLVATAAVLGSDTTIRFPLWRLDRHRRWHRLAQIADGNTNYLELGELLGIAATGTTVIAAVPVQQHDRSVAATAVLHLRRARVPGVASAVAQVQGATSAAIYRSRRDTTRRVVAIALAGLVVAAAAVTVRRAQLRRRRRRRHQHRTTRLPPPAPHTRR